MSCREMLSYDDFDYKPDDDDDDWDCYHILEYCEKCYRIRRIAENNRNDLLGNKYAIEKRVEFIYLKKELVSIDPPRCPICDSKRSCRCYDIETERSLQDNW